MLTEIRLKNFKCFKEETIFPLSTINLLTGINGKGKSTLLQSMLLMKQSMETKYFNQLKLRGNHLIIGSFSDLTNKNEQKSKPVEIDFIFGDKQIRITSLSKGIEKIYLKTPEKEIVLRNNGNSFAYKNGVESSIIFDWNKPSDSQMLPDENFDLLKEHFQKFDFINFSNIHYISADRVGAKESYDSPSEQIEQIDKEGKYAVHFLEKMMVDKNFREKLNQTVSQIFDTDLEVDPKRNGRFLRLWFKIQDKKYTPTNVGFGFSHILPILVAIFMAKTGDILIVENPEAHLHEKAQHELIRFLVKVAQENNIQILIETHSEIIANVLSVLVVEKKLQTDEVNILHFENQENPFFVKLLPDGRRDCKPVHFFDQTGKDLDRILFG